MSQNMTEKVVVITGASSGLGEAAARLLSTRGCHRRAGCKARGSHLILGERTEGRQSTRPRRGARTEFRYGSAQVAKLLPIYEGTPAYSF
jgi:NAD(P)-dependent dehydrogenase (short-subunit alcohol dehydrogenase family)